MTPELESYIASHIEPAPLYLKKLERDTNLRRINGRMCSGHIQGRLLKMLTSMIKPLNALEMGTFTGYSALCIAEGMPREGSLTTIELEDELEQPILEAFAAAGPVADKINLVIGDALEVCARFPDESFDMIFIDADKRQYPGYYAEAKRLLSPGGYLLADNTLWDSHVVEAGRNDPQTLGVREFNRIVALDEEMEAVIIPIRDGISIIKKRTK